jgi:hypothetical protein
MTKHQPAIAPKTSPGEFALGSVKSRAAARKLLENRRSADDWKYVTVEIDSVERGKELARLLRNAGRGGDARLIDTETGREIPF